MSDRLFNHSVNVVSYQLGTKKYAATIAWAVQVDYDKILLLMGSQSDTGNHIKKGQIIGVSALAENQMKIAEVLGDEHSESTDKLAGIEYTETVIPNHQEIAITIEDAVNQMIVEVIDVMHLEGIEEDNLIYGKVIKNQANELKFLNMHKF